MIKVFRWMTLLVLITLLTGCLHWLRVYHTYLQMHEFDQHFSIKVVDEFNVHFKHPILFSDDFISLAKLQPSNTEELSSGKKWRYQFRKVDEQYRLIKPEIRFYFDLYFNTENKLNRWSFSPLFLQMAPTEFLEVSLRSLGNAEINREKGQLKAKTELLEKIFVELPKKEQVLSQLGEPLLIVDKENQQKYRYNFLLETPGIEKGYEDRALCVIKLTFDNATDKLIKMSGRFVGVKISIDYRKFLDNNLG